MSDIRFRSDFTVTLDPYCTTGSDSTVARGAWVVPPVDGDAWDQAKDDRERHGKEDTDAGRRPVLRACMRGGHNTTFERGLMSVYIEAPGVVWWQLTRQRFMSLDAEDLSFSMESGRYRVLDPEFYLPPPERSCAEPKGFKPMRPELQAAGTGMLEMISGRMNAAVQSAWKQYTEMVKGGVAREVARLVLPNWALYCDGYVTAKPLSWLQFFSKRKRTPDTAVATFPQWEIEQVAAQCEGIFRGLWPQVYEEFVTNGRRAP